MNKLAALSYTNLSSTHLHIFVNHERIFFVQYFSNITQDLISKSCRIAGMSDDFDFYL